MGILGGYFCFFYRLYAITWGRPIAGRHSLGLRCGFAATGSGNKTQECQKGRGDGYGVFFCNRLLVFCDQRIIFIAPTR